MWACSCDYCWQALLSQIADMRSYCLLSVRIGQRQIDKIQLPVVTVSEALRWSFVVALMLDGDVLDVCQYKPSDVKTVCEE